jgi:peptidylprolyl isomerase
VVRKTGLVLLGILLLGAVLMAGCTRSNSEAQAKDGDTVKVQYTGKLEDGSIFDTSVGGDPLEFTLGQGQLIPGFEKAVIGMKVGESKTVNIPVDDAYGPYRDDLVAVVGRDKLPEGMDPVVGQQLQITQADGSIIIVKVIEVSETTITIDANHPLVGKNLIFEIKLVEIE